MTSMIDALRKAYLANGGTEEGFNARKDRLISEAREQATIRAAIEEANRPPDMNDLLRQQMMAERDKNTMTITLDTRDIKGKERRNG